MSLYGLRDAIVASIQSNVSEFRVVKAHGGKFNRDELKRVAVATPAALVTVLGGPMDRHGGQAVGVTEMAVFIVTGGNSVTNRKKDALNLVEAVCGLVNNDSWGYGTATAPTDVRFDNLYDGKVDRKGVALWVVTWSQNVDLAIYDPDTDTDLGNFYRMNTKLDLVPADGVIDLESQTFIWGTLMSAYGHIHVSTAVGTGIAAAGTFQKMAGTTTLLENQDADMPVVGRLRHTGTVSKPFLAEAAMSLTVSADALVTVALYKNGALVTGSKTDIEMTLAGGAKPIAIKGIVDGLSENEYVEVWVTADDTVTVTATKLSLTMVAT